MKYTIDREIAVEHLEALDYLPEVVIDKLDHLYVEFADTSDVEFADTSDGVNILLSFYYRFDHTPFCSCALHKGGIQIERPHNNNWWVTASPHQIAGLYTEYETEEEVAWE